MLLSELAQFLHNNNWGVYDSEGVDGNIFISTTPNNPDTIIALYPTGGLISDVKLLYDKVSVQVWVRGTSNPSVGNSLAQNIYNELHGFYNDCFVEEGFYIISVIGMQSSPIHVGQDVDGRHQYSINFHIEFKNNLRRG